MRFVLLLMLGFYLVLYNQNTQLENTELNYDPAGPYIETTATDLRDSIPVQVNTVV